MKVTLLTASVLFGLLTLVTAWSKEDHEIFRLRDEVGASEGQEVTFYDFLDIKSSASQDAINKAYKKKSRVLHPDKAKQSFIASRAKPKSSSKQNKPGVHVSKAPSQAEIDNAVKLASERFARLGLVVKILKGPGRERYNHFLRNGFPRWKGTGYYYARFRPGLGSVLFGLFAVFGGAGHYVALYLGWKRQTEFVDRYIRHARRAAWGDTLGIKGIPGVDGTATPPSSSIDRDEGGSAMNRRQRRMQEKDSKKEKDTKKIKRPRANGTSTPVDASSAPAPRGERKKVQAENGKVLIVDADGNVFLEEVNEDGVREEYLLDVLQVDEIPKPTIRQTALFRVPIWVFNQTAGRAMAPFRKAEGEEEDSSSDESEGLNLVPRPNGMRKRSNKDGLAR
ncbi:MAG: hypothetical protein M1812_000470 [Candelaria pacifica]|nr:MAG: hypothetical protein M1812_000470 [Candelaria pacifica]